MSKVTIEQVEAWADDVFRRHQAGDGAGISDNEMRYAAAIVYHRSDLEETRDQMLNRRVSVENILFEIANGKRDLPSANDCRMLALKLGTPKELWSEKLGSWDFEGHQCSLPSSIDEALNSGDGSYIP